MVVKPLGPRVFAAAMAICASGPKLVCTSKYWNISPSSLVLGNKPSKTSGAALTWMSCPSALSLATKSSHEYVPPHVLSFHSILSSVLSPRTQDT
jgi:hypothetical protein